MQRLHWPGKIDKKRMAGKAKSGVAIAACCLLLVLLLSALQQAEVVETVLIFLALFVSFSFAAAKLSKHVGGDDISKVRTP